MSIGLALKGYVKALATGVSVTFERRSRPVPIADLVSPLRYDILVRKDFMGFLDDHYDLYDRDRDAFMALCLKQTYFDWFVRVYCATFKPRLLAVPDRLVRAYRARVDRTVALYARFVRAGFDARFPIILNAGTVIAPTETGKNVVRDLYAGDGCHRVALLLHSGADVLMPEQYRVRNSYRYQPRDNTFKLLHLLALPAYYSFLSLAYSSQPCANHSALVSAVERDNPARAAELRSVLAADGMLENRRVYADSIGFEHVAGES
jgi:hypothetical protein